MAGRLAPSPGAAIGGRHAGEGALIGAAAGAIGGGVIGHSLDQEQQARLREQAPQTYVKVDQGQPLSTADVKALAQAKISDDVIISQIRNSHTVFHLSSADIIDLHNSNVSEKVIDYMINTQSGLDMAPQTSAVYVQSAPPPPPVETVYVAPGPGYIWIGGEWVWNGRWVWVSGHWSYPPRPHTVWVRGYWGHGPHGYYHHPGYWR